ncbi:MAG: hypothetical protein AB3K77_13135 [Methanosarcinaceae archaeon]
MKSIKEFNLVEILAVIVTLIGIIAGICIDFTPDFGMSVSPITDSAIQGTHIETTVTVEDETPILHNYQYNVTLDAKGVPDGIQVDFSPNTQKPVYKSKIVIYVDKSVKPGKYEIDIIGRSEHNDKKICTYMLTVKPGPGDFNIDVIPTEINEFQGKDAQVAVTVESINNYKYDVTLSATNLPNGVMANFSSNDQKPTYVSKLIMDIDKTVKPGSYEIEIKGTGENETQKNCKFTLTVIDENIIDTMDSTSCWLPFDEKMGSTEKVNSVSGMENEAVEIAYNLKKNGFVGISKNIDSEKLVDAKGIRYHYKLSGEPNTIQVKLIDNDGAQFGTFSTQTKAVDEWTLVEVSFSNFDLWWPVSAKSLSLENIEKLEFVVANKPEFGDSPGTGSVFIDEVEVIKN